MNWRSPSPPRRSARCCRSWCPALADNFSRGADPRPVRDEPGSARGLLPALLVRARRRLWSRRLFLRAHSDIRAAAAAGGHPAGGGCHDPDRNSDCVDMHPLDRCVLRHAYACLCATRLCHAVPFPRRHRRLRRPRRHPAPSRSLRHRLVPEQAGLLLPAACPFASYLLCRAIVRSPFGAVLAAFARTRPRPSRFRYNTRAYKITTVVAYGFGGLAGAFTPRSPARVPELFFWLTSGRVLIMVIVAAPAR